MPNPSMEQLLFIHQQIEALYPAGETVDENTIDGVIFMAITRTIPDSVLDGLSLPDGASTAGVVKYFRGNEAGYYALFSGLLRNRPEIVSVIFNALIEVLNNQHPLPKDILEVFKGHVFLHTVINNPERAKDLMAATNSDSLDELYGFIKHLIRIDTLTALGLGQKKDPSDKFEY